MPMRSSRMSRFTAVAVGLAALSLATVSSAEERNSAQVSILENGQASNSTGGTGKPAPLAVGNTVYENDIVETTGGARLELKLRDGSVIRIGPSSKLQLKSAYFGKQGDKKFSAKLFFGRVWSKVSGLVG